MNEKLRMRAYYYGFSETGVRPIDLVLCAVSAAGKLFHHTDQWTSEIDYLVENVRGPAPVDWIQNAADDAAEAHKKLITERDTAKADALELANEVRRCHALAQDADDRICEGDVAGFALFGDACHEMIDDRPDTVTAAMGRYK